MSEITNFTLVIFFKKYKKSYEVDEKFLKKLFT